MAGLLKTKSRLVSDPAIGVSDLMSVLKDFMQNKKCRDLEKILEVPRMTTWRTAVDVDWMAKLAPLFKSYAAVAPNTMLPPKKHRLAILQCHAESQINFGKKSDDDYADYCDSMIRVCFGQYRQLAQSPEAAERAFRKAGPSQVQAIEEVLALLKVSKDEEEPSEPTAPPVPGPSDPPPLPPPKSPPAASPPARSSTSHHSTPMRTDSLETVVDPSPIDPKALFESILAEPDFDPELTTPDKKKPKFKRVSSPFGFEKFVDEEMEDDLDRKDLIREAFETLPLGSDGKSQLTIFRNNAPRKPGQNKGSVGATVETKMGKNSKLLKAKAKAKKGMAKNPKKKPSTKDGAKSNLPEVPAEIEMAENPGAQNANPIEEMPVPSVTRRVSGKQSSVPPCDEEKGEGGKHVKEKKPLDMSRSGRRRRVVSKAWHSTYDAEIARGVSNEKARLKARKAHKEAAGKFDAEEPLIRKSQKKADQAKPEAPAVDDDDHEGHDDDDC